LIKKIPDKDKKDWEDFLKNKQKNFNKEAVKKKKQNDKKKIKISEKKKKK